jgi:MazG family protein
MANATRGDAGPLLRLIERLRSPDGCPWDRQQTAEDIRGYLLEEAHETAAAIDEGDWQALRGELGDLLFQVCFLSVLAAESGRFVFADAVASAHAKMVERHPHVFAGDREPGLDADGVAAAWELRKLAAASEARGDGGRGPAREGLLAGVPSSLPALLAAYRMTQKAAGIGFDWRHAEEVLAKLDEELSELRALLSPHAVRSEPATGRDAARLEEEIGDLLFAAANVARHLRVDPERALARANRKFRRRFAHVERGVAAELEAGTPPADLRERMEELWEEAKRLEREGEDPSSRG